MSKDQKQKALDTLNTEWLAKELSLKLVATNGVPGEGNPDAEIVFVGEGPGKDEDEQGRPFVGAAGKFLTELIESIGLRRQDVFIANIIKHRAPGNRDPLPVEIEEYVPWLNKQIEIIQPKIIVTLGRFSMEHFLGDGLSISKIHGEPKRVVIKRSGLPAGRQIILPMYHPAAALYRGDLRPVLHEDFAKIPKVLELINQAGTLAIDPEEAEAAAQQTLL